MTNVQYCIICNKKLERYQIRRGIQTCCRSCAMKKRYLSQEARDITSKSMKKALSTFEAKQKYSKASKIKWQNIELKQKLSKSLKKYMIVIQTFLKSVL